MGGPSVDSLDVIEVVVEGSAPQSGWSEIEGSDSFQWHESHWLAVAAMIQLMLLLCCRLLMLLPLNAVDAARLIEPGSWSLM